MTPEEFKKLKNSIEDTERAIIRNEAVKEQITKDILALFSVSSIGEAEEKLKALRQQKQELDASMESKMEKLEALVAGKV